jgi:hypothetical protein
MGEYKEVLEFRLLKMADILNFNFIYLYTLTKHSNEFLDPDNMAFNTTIIAIVWIIKEFCCFSLTRRASWILSSISPSTT